MATELQSVTVGTGVAAVHYRDITNMNGGAFPPHGTHGRGRALDVTIGQYDNHDTTAGAQLIEFAKQVVAKLPARWSLPFVCVDYHHRRNQGSTPSVLEEYMNSRSGPDGDRIAGRRPNELFIDCSRTRDDHHSHAHFMFVKN